MALSIRRLRRLTQISDELAAKMQKINLAQSRQDAKIVSI